MTPEDRRLAEQLGLAGVIPIAAGARFTPGTSADACRECGGAIELTAQQRAIAESFGGIDVCGACASRPRPEPAVAPDAVRDAEIARLVSYGCPLRAVEYAVAAERLETQALQAARVAIDRRHEFALLLGGRGSGKTVAAVWWLGQPHPASRLLIVGAPRFVDAVALPTVDRDRRMGELATARALVVDDLGMETEIDRFRSLFDGLINARYGARLRTLVTSNLEVEPWKKRYGERVTSRLRESGGARSAGTEDLRPPEVKRGR